MTKVKIKLKNPLGKKVKIDHGIYRIPCTFFYDQYKLDVLERYLRLQKIEYVIEEFPKKVKIIELKDTIRSEDKIAVETKCKTEEENSNSSNKAEENQKEEMKKSRKIRRGRRYRKKEISE